MAKKSYKADVKRKIKKTMKEFEEGRLHSGSKTGPVVTNPRQAVAISINQAKRKKAKKAKK